ncbi:MAG: helix-turn-helix domain-containing protein [Planctomycetota bacterium]|nr:helix-turn-helix domain-containing protein [Planctomycetota bacterium]
MTSKPNHEAPENDRILSTAALGPILTANGTELPSTSLANLAPLLVDRREAARLLGVSPGTVDNLRLRGELPSLKIASRRLYDVADLLRFIESRKGVTQ